MRNIESMEHLINKSTENRKKPVIGITIGDYNGIGPEIIIKLLDDKRINAICTPVIYGSGKVLTKYKRILENESFSYHQYNSNSFLNTKKANVYNCWAEVQEVHPGEITQEAGECAFLALEQASEHLHKGIIDAVVTCPINKKNIQNEEFKFPGHTEYFTEGFGKKGKDSLMLLCSEDLRVGVVTGHIPLSEVSKTLTKEKIIEKLEVMIDSLKHDFGIAKPRIAVMGLNPHAGEEGLLGREEFEIINPAVTEVKKKGNLVYGPLPSDGFFGTMEYKKFDAVLAMYHDQGLIPFKLLSFDTGVNFTAGLTIVRTSPDHGTAYNLAGKGVADPESLRQALYTAIDIVKSRTGKVEKQIRSNAKELLTAMKEESKNLQQLRTKSDKETQDDLNELAQMEKADAVEKRQAEEDARKEKSQHRKGGQKYRGQSQQKKGAYNKPGNRFGNRENKKDDDPNQNPPREKFPPREGKLES